MKIRLGFVSNSSSSSYVCDVCGNEVSGMDLCLQEAEMFRCVNQHTICENHSLVQAFGFLDYEEKFDLILSATPDELKEKVKRELNENEEEDYIDDYMSDLRYEGYPDKCCPICQFEKIYAPEAFKYLLKESNLTEEDFLKSLKSKFYSYKEFKKSL